MGLFSFLKKDKPEPSLPKLPSESKGDALPASDLPPLDGASLPPLDTPAADVGASLPPIGDVSAGAQPPASDIPPLGDTSSPAPEPSMAQSQEVVESATDFKLPDFSDEDLATAQQLSKKKSAASLLDTQMLDEQPQRPSSPGPVRADESAVNPQEVPAGVDDDLPPAPGPQEREDVPAQPDPIQEPVVDTVPEPASPQQSFADEEIMQEQQLPQPAPPENTAAPEDDFAAPVDEPAKDVPVNEPEFTPVVDQQDDDEKDVHIHDGGIFIEKGVYGGVLLNVAAIEKQVKAAANHVQQVVSDEVTITDKLKKWHDVLGEVEEKLMFIDEKLFEKGEM